MKNILILVAFFFCVYANAQDRYVNTTGGGNGTSDANAWSLSTALTTASAGMTVYIKKGTYAIGTGITSNINGTAASPIKFIGYDTTINDIVSEQYSMWDYGDTLPLTTIPLIQGASETTGFGITVNGDYIEFYNLQITDFITANTWNGDYGVIDNVIYFELGGQTGNPSGSGNAIPINGTYNLVNNCACYNVGSTCFTANNGNNTITNSWGGGDNEGQYMGYIFSAIGDNADNNLFEFNRIERRTSEAGDSYHGFIVKNGGNNNIFRNSSALNTGIEASYKNSTNNLWENIELIASADRDDTYAAGILIVNGSNNNTFKNIYTENNLYAVQFRDYDDGTSNDDARDAPEGGSNNTFINLVSVDARRLVWFTDAQGAATAINDDNLFINCTFTGDSGHFISKQTGINIDGLTFVNTIWKDTGGSSVFDTTDNVSNVVFRNNNFDGADTVPSANSYTSIISQTNLAFSFADTSVRNYAISTDVLDIGTNPVTFNSGANTDYLGATRDSPYTLGAYEFGASQSTGTPTTGFTGSILTFFVE